MGLNTQKVAIKAILEAVEVAAATVFQTVKTAPPDSSTEFDGFPSAYFVYDNYESDVVTNEENRRTANWAIYIFSYSKTLSKEAHYDKLYEIIDATVQAFDESYDLNGTADFAIPTPGEINSVDTDSGVGLLAEIRLRCWQDIDVRL